MKAGEDEIVLCNETNKTEWYDLRNIDVPYIVFASASDGCYKPVHGIRSIVKVFEGIAHTLSIEDQPVGQPVDELIGKIEPCPSKAK